MKAYLLLFWARGTELDSSLTETQLLRARFAVSDMAHRYVKRTGLTYLNTSLYLRLLKTCPTSSPMVSVTSRYLWDSWYQDGCRVLGNKNLAQPPSFSVYMLSTCSHLLTCPSQFSLPKFPPVWQDIPMLRPQDSGFELADGSTATSLSSLSSLPSLYPHV